MALRGIPRTAWFLAALAAVVRFVWIGIKGVAVSPDGHTYLGWGAQLLSGDLSLGWHVLYMGIVLYAAALQALFGPAAPLAWVILQSALVSLATIPLYLLARDLFGPRVALLAGLVHAFLFESFQWEAYTLSDSLFQAVFIAFLYVAVRAEPAPSRRLSAWRTVLLLVLIVLRPVGIVVAATFLAWKGASTLRTPRGRRSALVVLGVFALAVLVAWSSIVAFAAKMGPEYALSNAAGIIYDDDTDRVIHFDIDPYEGGLGGFILANPVAFLTLSLVRFGAFFTIALSRYSPAHIALNVVTLVPLFGLGLAMMTRALWRPGPLRLLALFVIAFAGFHALTLLDYDLRYRDPILPILEVFFAAGVVALWRRVELRASAAAAARESRRQEVHHEARDDTDAS